MSAIKKDVTIGDCRLILGDCLEVMPLLGKVDAVVACCDAVVYTDKHGKTANWEPETPSASGVNMGKPQSRNSGDVCRGANVTGATGGSFRGQSTGRGEGIEADVDQAKAKEQGWRTEWALHRRDAEHDLQADGGEDALQQVRGNGSTRCASCGRGSHEQRGRKFGSSLLAVPHQPPQARVVERQKGWAILTDPPYGIDYGNAGGFSAAHGWASRSGAAEWDKERPAPEVFAAMLGLSDAQIIWGGNYFADLLPPSMRWLAWDKGQRNFSLADMELAWTSQQKAVRVFTYARGKAVLDGKQHPTQKPVALMEWCLGFLPNAETILDPFMGSGTTLVACAKLGRKGIGVELDPDYFEIACKRVRDAYAQPDLFVAPPKKPIQEGFDI